MMSAKLAWPNCCRFGTIYYLSMGCIALASTSMHTAQMRLFGCSCCHSHSVEDLGVHKLKTEHALHTVPWQTLFKRMDVGCVFGGLSIGTLCQGGAITAAILHTTCGEPSTGSSMCVYICI